MATSAIKTLSISPLNELLCIPLSDERYGGYKLDILKQNLTLMEQTLVVCSSCKGIMRDACVCAGKNMCECCCPQTEQAVPVESIREAVKKLPCGCPLDSKGCAWSGLIEELDNHLGVCEHLMVPCPFVGYGCEVGSVRRLEMQLHLKEFSTQHLLGRIMRVEEDNRRAFEGIDSLKKENKGALEEIAFLKKENERTSIESKKAFEEIVILRQEINYLKDKVGNQGEIRVLEANYRETIGGKLLEGIQFVISDVKKQAAIPGMTQGPIFYLKRYKIQVQYEFSPRFSLYIMRIPGEYDTELGTVRVGLVFYKLINSKDSSVLFEYKRTINHLLANLQRSSMLCDITTLADYAVVNDATIRLLLELKLD